MSVTINGDTGISGVNGSAATPAIQGDDADTGIFFGTNEASITTGGTSRVHVDSAGRVGVNTSSPNQQLNVHGNAEFNAYDGLSGSGGYFTPKGLIIGNAFDAGKTGTGDNRNAIIWQERGLGLVFATNDTERAQIYSDGGLSLKKYLEFANQADDGFSGYVGSSGYVINSGSGNDLGIRTGQHLIFASGGSTEHMRLNSGGDVHIAKTEFTSHNTIGHTLHASGWTHHSSMAGVTTLFLNRSTSVASTEGNIVEFYLGGSYEGNIYINSSGIFFNSVSDYRLKENVINITDGITRLKQLSPRRFNFIKNIDVTVDGFIAHEVQTVVPEAVCGEKDGEEMQGMDHARLVPLLTAALQEAIAKIETLEERLNDAGIS